MRQADDEPRVLTNVRGADGRVGVEDVVLGTVCGGDRETTNVRGTRPCRSSSSSTSRLRRRTTTTTPLRGTRLELNREGGKENYYTEGGGTGASSTSKSSSAAIHFGISELISRACQWGRGDPEPFKEGAKPGQWQAKRCTRADTFCAKPNLAE